MFRMIARLVVGEGEFSASLAARYPHPRLWLKEGLNQACRLLHLPVAFSLTTVGVETNNTCNLRCSHCPVSTLMRRPRGVMSWSLFQSLVKDNPGIERFYLTNWGEPLLHPQIIDMVAYAHEQKKHVSLTTNATLLSPELNRRLLEAGLNVLKVSVDGTKKTYEKIRRFSYEKIKENIKNFISLRDQMGGKTWVEVSMVIYDETTEEVKPFLAEWSELVEAVNLQPRFFTLPRKKRRECRDLWRLLVVLWDGRVVPCCPDFEGEIVLGHVKENKLAEIFNGPPMRSLRQQHLKKEWMGLCRHCHSFEADYHLSRKRWLKAPLAQIKKK